VPLKVIYMLNLAVKFSLNWDDSLISHDGVNALIM